jgi:hypothetical protein
MKLRKDLGFKKQKFQLIGYSFLAGIEVFAIFKFILYLLLNGLTQNGLESLLC